MNSDQVQQCQLDLFEFQDQEDGGSSQTDSGMKTGRCGKHSTGADDEVDELVARVHGPGST